MDLEKVHIQKKAALCLGLFILQLKSVLSMGIPGISKGKRVKLALAEPQTETAWGATGWERFAEAWKKDGVPQQIRVLCPLLGIRTLRISNKGRLLVSNVLIALFFVGPMTTVLSQQNYGCCPVCYMESDVGLSVCLLLLHSLGRRPVRRTSDGLHSLFWSFSGWNEKESFIGLHKNEMAKATDGKHHRSILPPNI